MDNKKVSVRYLFGDEAQADISLAVAAKSLSRQAVLMAEGDDPEMQEAGEQLLEQIALQAEHHAYNTIKREIEQPHTLRGKKTLAGASEGGKKGGGHNKKLDPIEVKRAHDFMSQPERNRASILAERYGVSARAIRNALKEADSE